MKKTGKLAAVAAMVMAMAVPSAFADSRHQNETNAQWRSGGRDNSGYRNGNYDRDYVRGVVERVDFRRGTLLLREERSGRRITVFMNGRNRNNRRGVDLDDLRRGDRVTLAGDWQRGGVFEAYRVEDVRGGRW
jgi:hypothetical protein